MRLTRASGLRLSRGRRGIASLESSVNLDINRKVDRLRKTKIICTVGPSSWHEEGLEELLLNGMNVMRLNFSHGTHEQKRDVIARLRKVVERYDYEDVDVTDGSMENVCSIAADTKGPEIRTGSYTGDATEILITMGQHVILHTDPDMENSDIIGSFDDEGHHVFVDYRTLQNEVDIGQAIYIDDGLVSLTVIDRKNQMLRCKANNSAMLGTQKGVNVPGCDLQLPIVSAQDQADLRFAAEQGVDMVFASFIRCAMDVHHVRFALGDAAARVKIFSKIENQQGCDNFDEILQASDGVMIARGDLGIEIPADKVFLAQKMMIAKCNIVGKPAICATQMLESMVHNPRATRAECSDVANAVLDGADAVMLSGETAKGKYPAEAVKVMAGLCQAAETVIDYSSLHADLRSCTNALPERNYSDKSLAGGMLTRSYPKTLESVGAGTASSALQNSAGVIVVWSRTGLLAKILAKYRPHCPILMVTADPDAANTVNIVRGVFPIVLSPAEFEEPTQAIKIAVDWGRRVGVMSGNAPVLAVQTCTKLQLLHSEMGMANSSVSVTFM